MASCRDKNDERANARPPLEWQAGSNKEIDGAGKAGASIPNSPSERRVRTLRHRADAMSAENSCNFAATGISLHFARGRARVAVCVHRSGVSSAIENACNRVGHLSYGTERYRIDAFYRARKSAII